MNATASQTIDALAISVREAEDDHARLIAAKAPVREILLALRKVMVAVSRLAADSGEDEMQALYQIEDIDAEIARL